MPAHLVISTDEGVIVELRLGTQPVTIGRNEDSTVRSLDRRTSRRHAVIRRVEEAGDGGAYYEVEDLGSAYGTLLNGRSISRERLGPGDALSCGGLHLQFSQVPDEAGDGPATLAQLEVEVSERRDEVRRLIEEQAELRREVGVAREDRTRAERQRDEEHDEAARLRELLKEEREQREGLSARIEALGNELRNERSARAAAPGAGAGEEVARLQKQLAEEKKGAERHRSRAIELEEREGQWTAREQALKKEVERLGEMNKKREQREAELTQAVRPALLRVAQLTDELERTRVELARAQADLEALRRR